MSTRKKRRKTEGEHWCRAEQRGSQLRLEVEVGSWAVAAGAE